MGFRSDKNPFFTVGEFNQATNRGENIDEKILRFFGILFMGITAAVTLLSGVGTTCVALDAEKSVLVGLH